jgi:hypothetical protein
MLGLQAVQKIAAFVFTRNHQGQGLCFHLALFAQIVTAKVTFSSNFAPPQCEYDG